MSTIELIFNLTSPLSAEDADKVIDLVLFFAEQEGIETVSNVATETVRITLSGTDVVTALRLFRNLGELLVILGYVATGMSMEIDNEIS